MPTYLERLQAEFDEITTGLDGVVQRAADEDRDLTDTEQAQVDRDQERLTALRPAIERYTELGRTVGAVHQLRGQVPTSPSQRQAGNPEEPAYDLLRDFPTVGDYAITVHRAMVDKAPDAIEKLERATAHQVLADNPGIVPKPILGPVINLFATTRPFISSITQRPLPAGKFDRPVVTQHVAVGVQANEKDLTASQKMLVNPLPVVALTYAGHLNISRQDIKWTSPGILQLVYEDFAAVYAQQTDAAACAAFVASVTNSDAIPSMDAEGIYGAIYGAAAQSLDDTNQLPDTLWAAPDVWGALGSMVSGQGNPLFATLQPGSASGSPMGLRLVVDGNFAPGTLIMGPSRYAEHYEDVDGLLQVGEPDVLGQLVGYAGFAAFLNTAPQAFTTLTLPAPVAGNAS